MLQIFSALALLIPIPVWLLMIFAPRRDETQRITSRFLIFIPLGIVFIFLAIGVLVQGSALGSIVGDALNAAPADQATVSANALKTVHDALPTLAWAILAGSSVLDIAGGHLIYNATQRMGTPSRTAGALIFLTWLFGALGMMIFALWYYLSAAQPTPPIAAAAPAAQTVA